MTTGLPAYASFLASRGYVALAIDYFTPMGMTREKWEATFWAKYTDKVREDMGQGIEVLKALPYVAPSHIGVVGFSLGGYFSLVLATRDDVKGIVSYYGAYAGPLVNRVGARYSAADIVAQLKAPVLMLHGEADQEVPIAFAHSTRNLIASGGRQAELVTYPGVGHAFNFQGTPTYDARATADAQEMTLAFLNASLK